MREFRRRRGGISIDEGYAAQYYRFHDGKSTVLQVRRIFSFMEMLELR
jgi:hypothetical protein